MDTVWHIRFSPALLEFFRVWLPKKSSRYIVGEELGSETEKLHYHMNVRFNIMESAVRKAVNTELSRLGLKGVRGGENTHYRMKPVFDEAYACKEGNIVLTSGYTTEEIAELIEQGKTKFPKKADSPEQTQREISKKAKDDYLEKVISQGVDYVREDKADKHAQHALASACRYVLKVKGGRTDVNKSLPVINAIMYRLGGVSQYAMENSFIADMERRVLGNRSVYSFSETNLISHE